MSGQDKDNPDDIRPGEDLPARLDRMTEEFVPQVRSEAWRMFTPAPHALELEELVSLGNVGLAQARDRWMGYCAKRGFDPECTRYYVAYILRRVRGAMLDAMRAGDWVTRSVRARAKALREAGLDTGKTEAELAAATDMSIQLVRETVAAMSRKPVSIDAEPVEVAIEQGDVESEALVSSVLGAAVGTLREQPMAVQQVLACWYYAKMDVRDIAAILGISEDQVRRLHAGGVAEIHGSMLREVA